MTTASRVLRAARWFCNGHVRNAEHIYADTYAIAQGQRRYVYEFGYWSRWLGAPTDTTGVYRKNTPMPFILWTHAINKYRPAWAGYPQEDNNMDT